MTPQEMEKAKRMANEMVWMKIRQTLGGLMREVAIRQRARNARRRAIGAM